jgi:hypothetical protein
MRVWKAWLPTIGALMMAAGVATADPKVGAKPADVTLTDLNGKSVKLSALRRGKPVLVNFWATW